MYSAVEMLFANLVPRLCHVQDLTNCVFVSRGLGLLKAVLVLQLLVVSLKPPFFISFIGAVI